MTTTHITAADVESIDVDPNELVIAENIRTHADVDTTTVDSIRDFGVIAAVIAQRTADGTIEVIDGQRRTLAAREAGVATIPVRIVPQDADLTDKEKTLQRIRTQWITNEHRQPLRASERVGAVEQLTLAGVSATGIAKALKIAKPDVDRALTVVKSKSTVDRLDTMPSLTLDQAATIAEWEHDSAAVDELLDALDTDGAGGFEHRAQSLADNKAEREAVAATIAELGDVETTRVDPGWRVPSLTGYVVASTGLPATIDDVPEANRLAWIIADEVTTWRDKTGADVDETLIDWSIEHEDDCAIAPGEGLIDPRYLSQHTEVTTTVQWRVHQPTQCGLMEQWTWERENPDHTVGETIDEEAKAARQKAKDDAEAERKRAEMRRTKALNKASASAREVRIAHITTWLTRKTLPKEHKAAIAQFVADTMWTRYTAFSTVRQDGSTHGIAADFLGVEERELPNVLAEATADRAQLIGLAVALAAHEAITTKDAWRDRYEQTKRIAYLDFLEEVTGYTLADVEKAMTGAVEHEDIDIA